MRPRGSRVLAGLVLGAAALPATAVAAADAAWTEVGDARSFPDGAAQSTRGSGPLVSIEGATGPGDPRDAYCILVTDPGSFRATTDPAVDPSASASFDTRLFLLDPWGAPLLANDASPGSRGTTGSTLSAAATDGSGFALSRAEELVLVVAGASDQPLDPGDGALFDLAAGASLVHAVDPEADRFDAWAGGSPATGSYRVALAGAEPCQDQLDLVILENGNGKRRVCRGLGDGTFARCEEETGAAASAALGRLDADARLDLVLPGFNVVNVCRGEGDGFGECADAGVPPASVLGGPALGHVDDDRKLDAIFPKQFGPGRVCLGDGTGSLPFCGDLGDADDDAGGLPAVGYLGADRNLDVVIAAFGPNLTCRGDGAGAFQCEGFDGFDSRDVALGDLDGDGDLDAVFANVEQPNRVCLGNGLGGFPSCSDVNADENYTVGVSLAYLDDDDDLDALFVNGIGPSRVCLGTGSGGFGLCADIPVPEDFSTFGTHALALIDGDANLDLVIPASTGITRICLGNGVGTFSCSDGDTGNALVGFVAELGPLHLFTDGFESDDLSAWSSVVGARLF